MELSELSAALEAVLFAAGDSVDFDRLRKLLDVTPMELEAALSLLEESCEKQNRGIRLIRLENRLQLVTAPEYYDLALRVLEKRKTTKLSSAAMEVLSIVAYYQPVTRSYIEKLRGVDSSNTVNMLTEQGLIEPKGKLEAPGRPTLFGTTENFLRVVGLQSLEQLPPLPEIKEDEGREELQMAIEHQREEM